MERLRDVVRYSHVMHIGSTVRGRIREDKDALDAISAVLPAGTLSGAPKIRAMQLIGELENNKRGIYGGAVGYVAFNGDMDTCVEECIQATAVDNLHIMTSGPLPPNPSELLASRQAGELFDFLSEIYDLVIIDSPPICVATDILTLGDRIAGILLVFRYGVTTEEDAGEAVKRVELANMNLVGFVLNGIDVKTHGGYYSKYSKYSTYGADNNEGSEESDSASASRTAPQRQQLRKK